MPLAGASTSIVALSVSMSKSGSPFVTAPPSSACQVTTRPRSMSMSTLGMMTSTGIRRGPSARRRMAAAMPSTCGTAAFSRAGLYGIGQSAPPRRRMGASRKSNASLSATMAAISAPMPAVFTPSWTISRRPVLRTLARMAPASMGRTERRSMTSASAASSAPAASSALWTMMPDATTVMPRPSRRMAARPMGVT